MVISKYVYSFFCLGMVGKFYDDITELYLVDCKKHEKIIETIKTVWTLLIFYFIAYYADNKYDILWMMFVWTFLPLVDWIAFTEDPYLFSLVVSITVVGMMTLICKNYLSNVNLVYLIPCFIIYCICSPITEFLCFDFNGPLRNFFKTIGVFVFPDKTNHMSHCDLEVSVTKLITRIVSFVFLSFMILIMSYINQITDDQELSQILSSAILLSLCNNGYFLLSIINQYYSIYINPEIMKRHHKTKNGGDEPQADDEPQATTEATVQSKK